MHRGRPAVLFSSPRLRVAAAAVALLAAWAPQLSVGAAQRTVIVVRDVSASVGEAASARAVEKARRDATGVDRWAFVSFGETARLGGSGAGPPPGRHASSLAAGLRRAASLVRTETGRGDAVEVWLATDGLATDLAADLDAAALALRAAGCGALRLLPVEPAPLPSRTTALIGPGRVATGEAFALEARGIAGDGGASVELVRDGEVVDARGVASAGPFRIVFLAREESVGGATYTARTRAGAALPSPSVNVTASAPGGALLLGAEYVRPNLARLLDMTCRVAPRHIDRPAVAALMAGHDLVVVDGSLGADVSAEAAAELTGYVEGGGGLLLLGGPSAFVAGGWDGPLNDLSPLRSLPEGDAGLALYLALDGSGSMAEPWRSADGAAGTRTRDEIVRAAAMTLIRGLPDDTTVRIRRFAGGLLPDATPPRGTLLADGGRESALHVLRNLAAPGGGTALVPVLAEALRLARADTASSRKHALVFTDGRTGEHVELGLAAREVIEAGCGLTVVFPTDARENARQVWNTLDAAGATMRLAHSAEELPAIFRDAATRAGGAQRFLGPRRLRQSAAGDALFGESGASPQAMELNHTWTADDATVVLWTEEDEPAAAIRNTGRGRVAALATRPGDLDWLSPAEALPIVRALRGAVQRRAAGSVRFERTADGVLLVGSDPDVGSGPEAGVPDRVELRLDDLPGRTLALRPAGGGLLRTDADAGLAAGAGGWVRLLDAEGGELALCGLDRAAPPEYRDPPPADLDRLAALAAGPGSRPGSSSRPWLALASVLCLVAAGASALRAHA